MGIGEILLITAMTIVMIVGIFKNAKNSRGTVYRPPPQQDEDLARMRQMKEWDRFDNSKNGKS